MNHFLPSTPAPSPSSTMDGTDPFLVSHSTSTSSLPMETNPQLFQPNATFWHDMSFYACVSPQCPYDYQSDDTSGCPKDVAIKVTQRGSGIVRSKAQSEEAKLRKRAQNRDAQRAYRARRDDRVKELEMQLKEMGKQNEILRRDHAEVCAAHEKLKGEQAQWREVKKAFYAS